MNFTKGQLISKCPSEKSVSSKIPTKIFLDFCPEIFVAFWGLPSSFLNFQQPSLFMILLNKSPGSPKRFQKAPRQLQKNSGQNSRNIFVGIKDILKLTDLQNKNENVGKSFSVPSIMSIFVTQGILERSSNAYGRQTQRGDCSQVP